MPAKRVSIAIPASIVSDIPHLREKTARIGIVGRAAAMFRINEIIIYCDDVKANQTAELNLITLLLSYMETPQYLRKRLFRLQPELQFAGILPPLRTPHHPLNREIKKLRPNEIREGVTLSQTVKGTLVDVGVERPLLVSNKQLAANKRVSLKIEKIGERIEALLVNHDDIKEYWGYDIVSNRQPLGKIMNERNFELIIATSKHGRPIADVSEEIDKAWKNAKTVLVAFGAPTRGLYEVVENEGLCLDDISDFVINTIPMQGTETVRTEEAVLTSLSVLRNFAFKA